MQLDQMMLTAPLASVPAAARAAEERGYDAWMVSETAHDPFLAAALAAEHTDRIGVGTAIAVAFSRSPMHVAYLAHDLQALSGGRFLLGLGSQIKAHITNRFSAEWSSPAARMREYVQALQAIWRAWNDGNRLVFRGEFYRHTLMTPFFTPEPNPSGRPPVYLAAVGPRMTEVAGEVADGLLCHSFTTEHYLRTHTLPALGRGAEAGGRTLGDVDVNLGVFVVTGRDRAEREAVARGVRGQIAFYGSTPAYRRVLEAHGWGDLQDRLYGLSLSGAWDEMAAEIPDDVVEAFAIVAEPDQVGARIHERFGDVVDRVSLYTDFVFDNTTWERVRADLQRG